MPEGLNSSTELASQAYGSSELKNTFRELQGALLFLAKPISALDILHLPAETIERFFWQGEGKIRYD